MEYPEEIMNLITRNAELKDKGKVFNEIKKDEEAKQLLKKGKVAWALMSSTREMPVYKVEESYQRLHERLSNTKKSSKLIVLTVKYAAAVLLLIGIGAISYQWGKIKSGISGDAELKYTSIVADQGQVSKIILPDSSVVWLNSNSKLTYDNKFSYSNRALQLSGQAFLQVRKNKELPLTVACGNLQVKVLGTRFDVDAYPDEEVVKVTLESGKVQLLNTKKQSFDYKLSPGQMAKFSSKNNTVEIVDSVNVQNFIGWKDGELIFSDASMDEVIKRLERKFNLTVEVNNPKIYTSVFNARFKDESLKEILDYLHYSCLIDYQLIPAKGDLPTHVIFSYKK